MSFSESFKPMLTPKEMLQKGIFGGTYFYELIDYRDFPKEWFDGLNKDYYCSARYNKEINPTNTIVIREDRYLVVDN